MGCSVEVRVPLLDHIFVERVCHLPLARRFEAGRNKPLLRRLMRGILRDSLLDAPKRGFTPPGGFIGSLAYKQADILLDGQLVRHGWVDAKQLEKIIQKGRAMPWLKTLGLRHALGITQSPWFLFRLLAFERWYENLASPAIVHDPLS
jgi:asparagine synthetase B (glutamine-hydrolysing)